MHYGIKKILGIIDGKWMNKNIHEAAIEYILFDSRKIIFPKSSVFFAFKGVRNDGHQFIESLYEEGVRNFVVSNNISIEKFPEANFIKVKDTLTALQQLAVFHRKQFDLKTIGITGSNGKTIVKEWLFQLLHDDFNIVRSPKSYNSQIGVPLSVLQIEPEHDLGIFEVGISTVSEMQKLQAIVDCEFGIFTNIGPAHDAGFKNKKEKISEKLTLFKNASTIIYCKDHEPVAKQIQALKSKKLFSWSHHSDANLQIIKEFSTKKGDTIIEGIFEKNHISTQIPFTDSASIENAIHCWALLLLLNFQPSIISRKMMSLEPVAMRLELKEGINNCSIVNDSYNSDLASLQIALDFLGQQERFSRRTIILSDILQTGKEVKKLYSKVARLLSEKKIDNLIGIGKEIPIIEKYLSKKTSTQFYTDTSSFLINFNPDIFEKQIILLKGARQFEFEKIANRLAQKNHKTVLEIDLNALVHNLNFYSQLLKPDTKMMVMVKAAAYGSGSVEVARLLEFQKVDYLAVAYADEGVQLRKVGIQLPIMVLNPEEATFDSLVRYQLEPEIYSLSLLRNLIEYLSENQKITVHLKLDTGMRRLGFEEKDLTELCSFLKENPNIHVKSIFSHLAASENPEHDDFTKKQFEIFLKLYKKIASSLGYKPLRHILNSSGIHRFSKHQWEMVRLGIGLYGIDSNQLIQNKLERVHTLKATISQIREVAANTTIGYGRRGKIKHQKWIATISIGYADGFLRKAGNGNYEALIRGKKVPTIGNICMDMAMVDITAIPQAREGDEVIIFGKDLPVETLAGCLETIPYEVFTNLSERIKRIYFQD
jgi:Alr-MurF fusion protein